MSLFPVRKLALASALPLALAPLALMVSAPAMAADPTVDQVYSAARGGHVDQALTMMQSVLKDHPNNAKAHFVEAELLAKAGRTAEARTELAKAEQLKPGLPFVSASSVTALKQQLSTSSTGTATRTEVVQREGHGFPWIPVIVVAGLIFLVIAFLRRRSQANDAYPAQPVNPGYGSPYGNNGPQGGPWNGGNPGYGGQGYGGQGYGAPPPQQGGFGGGGIMSSLAGGAAAGAGFAAGEAVIGKMFGEHDREKVVEREVPAPDRDRDVNQDMGGNDFGISDSGSWDDDGSSSSSDDW